MSCAFAGVPVYEGWIQNAAAARAFVLTAKLVPGTMVRLAGAATIEFVAKSNKQWAAVSTYWLEINEPPQIDPPVSIPT